jgi:hypothetical protein
MQKTTQKKMTDVHRGTFGARRLAGLLAGVIALGVVVASPTVSLADENGVSFWVPGLFGSLAAVPQQPGVSMTIINYYTSVGAGAAVATSREISVGKLNPVVNINLNANVNANAELVFINPGYTFATPVLGGQLFLGAFGAVGRVSTEVNGTISAGVAGFTATRQGSISDTTPGFGDIYPQAMLRWNNGVNNWIVYATGDIPVGTYASTNLSNLGLGHGAIDAGGGYTYLNPQTGHEITAVTGFTYNLINPSTNYQSGVDWHLDWGASQFLTKQLLVGAVGYFYEQVSADSGSGDRVGAFESGVMGVGPQIGYIIPAGPMQVYVNAKAYWEFDGHDRPSGWNAWLTLSLQPSAPVNPRSAMLTK